jgi:hypothetical protein
MARNYIPISEFINDFIISIDDDDHVGNVSDVKIRQLALRGLRDMGFDMLRRIRSLKLPVNPNDTVDLPDDFVDWIKVGGVGGDGIVYVFAENKNINISQKYTLFNGEPFDLDGNGLFEREDDKTPTLSSPFVDSVDPLLFQNFIHNGISHTLYGYSGGKYRAEFRINLDQNRIELSTNHGVNEVVIEYVADEALSSNPMIHAYAVDALNHYVYYRMIERKRSVPANEKARARQEYFNERRIANARLKSFTKSELVRISRKNFKMTPKA